jgi:DNA-directed RNA polymerase III subunit RPC1
MEGAEVELRIDRKLLSKLKLEIGIHDIKMAIYKTKILDLNWEDIRSEANKIVIKPADFTDNDHDLKKGAIAAEEDDGQGISAKPTKGRRKRRPQTHYQVVQELRRNLLNVVVKGYPETNRAIIRRKEAKSAKEKDEFELLVEGYGLKACMTTDGVDGLHTRTNSVMETAQVLGIEAARNVIEAEIQVVMESMDIDGHHIGLLACIMTLKGEVLGITRFGMVKMRDSVLQLASFEKTPDHLFEAATRMKSDPVAGVSESIIMGQQVKLGTGIAEVVRPLGFSTGQGGAFFAQREPLFEKAWKMGAKGREGVKGWQDVEDGMWKSLQPEVVVVPVDADGDVAML